MYDFTYFECRKSSQLHVVSYFYVVLSHLKCSKYAWLCILTSFCRSAKKHWDLIFKSSILKVEQEILLSVVRADNFVWWIDFEKIWPATAVYLWICKQNWVIIYSPGKKADAKNFSIRQFSTLQSVYKFTKKHNISLKGKTHCNAQMTMHH